MALTICFIFHMIVEDNGELQLNQIAIFRKFMKWIKGLNTDLQFFESAVKLLLTVEGCNANYSQVF